MEKKKFYQKKWFIVVLILLILAGIGGSTHSKDKADSTDSPTESVATNTTQVTTSEPTKAVTEEATPVPTKKATKKTTPTPTDETTKKSTPVPTEEPQTRYKASTYKVGNDIPAGEYVVFCDSYLGYMEVSKDSSGELDSIISNANFYYNTIVTLKEGQYFKMTSAYAIPIEEVKELDTTGEGMFKVGTFLKPGEYKLEADSSIGYGYVEISKDSSHDLMSIVSNDNFENTTYISVEDGQYLTLSGARIVE